MTKAPGNLKKCGQFSCREGTLMTGAVRSGDAHSAAEGRGPGRQSAR